MTREALEELARYAPADHPLQLEISAALDHCKAESRRAYDEQRAEIEAAKPATA